MGFLSEDQQLFRQGWGRLISNTSYSRNDEEKPTQHPPAVKMAHARVKKTIPLYIGLTTGFCGSFTSFSGFMRDSFLALSNDLSTPVNHSYSGTRPNITSTVPRNGGYSFMAVCAVIILTICVCYSALRVGAHIAIYLDRVTPPIPFHACRRIVDPLMVFVAWGVWLGAVFMAIWPPDRPGGPESSGSWARETWRGQAIFSCVFAPLGCLARFYAALKLNALISSFPLGTFAANIFGTAVLGMAFDLKHVSITGSGVSGGRVGCQVLQGIMDGFCGTLTTVSTWILELDALKRHHSYVYGGASVVSGLGVLVVVMGSVRWSVGWSAVACDS
jgi:fluoride ion exporter CrcB/FEX